MATGSGLTRCGRRRQPVDRRLLPRLRPGHVGERARRARRSRPAGARRAAGSRPLGPTRCGELGELDDALRRHVDRPARQRQLQARAACWHRRWRTRWRRRAGRRSAARCSCRGGWSRPAASRPSTTWMRTPTASFISVVNGPSRLLPAPSVDISRRSVAADEEHLLRRQVTGRPRRAPRCSSCPVAAIATLRSAATSMRWRTMRSASASLRIAMPPQCGRVSSGARPRPSRSMP